MFMKRFPWLCLALALTLSCARQNGQEGAAPGGSSPTSDISTLSDEFDSAKSLPLWKQAYREEGWNADQLEGYDIGRTQAGWMMMMPYASTWYRDYRGVLAYKEVKGDFVVSTRLRVNRRGGTGAPRSQFSLAGIMIRAPRQITPRTWTPGGENYVFLSLGAADSPGNYQFEAKITTNSDSQLGMSPAPGGEAIIQVARIGSTLILLKNAGGTWTVHQRYHHPGLPETVQVGLTCYTDWPTANQLSPQQHNGTVIRSGNPDLVALFDYVRYRRPHVPANLAGRRLDSPQAVSDQELLQFLGNSAASK